MDQLKGALNNFTQGNNNTNEQAHNQGSGSGSNQGSGSGSGSGGGGFLGGLGDKFNAAAGGGRESEKNEDYLDKGEDSLPQHTYLFAHRDLRNNMDVLTKVPQ